jgi:hypothetical protein
LINYPDSISVGQLAISKRVSDKPERPMNFDMVSPRRPRSRSLVDEHSPPVPARPSQDCRFTIIMLSAAAQLGLVPSERNDILYVLELYNLDPRQANYGCKRRVKRYATDYLLHYLSRHDPPKSDCYALQHGERSGTREVA